MIWKDIKGYEGYQVSDTGLVRTYNKITYTSHHGIRHWKDRILSPKIRRDGKRGGDARVDLWKNGKSKTFKISRLVAFTFFDEDIDNHNLTVNHKDGDWTNNNLDNLEIISLADNIRHAFKNGLMPTNQPIKIINKASNEVNCYNSLSKASIVIGKNIGYIANQIKKNKFENDLYRWELIRR